MSPEQTDRKGRISPATDVWALGLIAFRLLTGRDFWVETDSLPMLLREMCINDIPFAGERARELGLEITLPHGFDAWFARCVNRDIDARFPEAGEAVRAFAELVDADAPRGAVVITGGRSATGALDTRTAPGAATPSATARTAASEPPPSGVQIRPVTSGAADPVSVGAATVGLVGAKTAAAIADVNGVTGSTGDPLIATNSLVNAPPAPAAPKSNARMGVVAAIIAFAAIGAGVSLFRDKGTGTGAPTPSAAASHAPSPALSASTAPAAAVDRASCPAGMVLIGGGKMFMGARDLDENASAKPPHEVTVSSYCLGKTEVTTAAYQACVDKGECERALEQVSWPNLTDEKKKRYSPFCNAGKKDRMDHPINCVAWPMAENYCRKNKLRLPTEAEWEFAARGSSQRKYPWGDDPPSGKFLNACGKECSGWGDSHAEKHQMMYEDDDGFPATAPVGSFPAGASAQGVMDLAGNVWEWTADYFAPYSEGSQENPKGPATGEKRVVRGGDFFGFQADWARPAWRWKTDPETYNHAIGFRCAADPS
jgi:formylglycine-generating enzyme required for sulfatase activity